ncbi:superoxide dismutase [Rickettsiales bacterium]|nr:superoxide dismutase [Rickettsiales bacterium]
MPFNMPQLRFEESDLEPHMSSNTIQFHFYKHHAGYLNKLNTAINGTELEAMSIEDVIKSAHKNKNVGVFNNAAQFYNHNIFWESISNDGGGQPNAKVEEVLVQHFGSVDAFKEELTKQATTQFGSGWTWLVCDKDKKELKIMSTSNAATPITEGLVPVLCIDVWEHSYYLDYQNKRPEYIEKFLSHLINWNKIEEIFVK